MDIIIRRALPEDAGNYTDCAISCWQAAYRGIVPDEYLNNMPADRDLKAEKYRESFAKPGDIQSYCVVSDGKMIGLLTIDIINAEIWAIYLLEEYWGKGIGKEVLDFAISEMKRMKHSALFLWVLEGNGRAKRFYERNGFRFSGIKREKEYGKALVQLRYVLYL
jgi:ribosomal protein S18 acetylase RimI-like enzyme